jgi:hypothetical protein
VIEKYPSVIGWTPPRGTEQALSFPVAAPDSGHYPLRRRGVVKCSYCALVKAHELSWPADAYFRWEIRGVILWAWSAEHARVLLEFISGRERDPSQFPPHAGWPLRHSRQVLTAKARQIVARRIQRTLDEGSER